MPPYIHNTKIACFVTLRECPYAPIHLDAPCMFGCPHMFEYPAVCLGDVWMPPVHTQHIESMLCHTKGCPYAPIHLDVSISVDAPCIFGYPYMVGHHPYIWMPSFMFGCPPVCLVAPHMCGSTLYVWMPTYFWMAPCMFQCLHMFGHPLYVCMPPCLDTTHMFGSPHMCSTAGNTFQLAAMFGCPLYVLMPPYVWMPSLCLDTPCMFGSPICLDAPPICLDVHMFGWPPVCLNAPHMFGHLPVCLDAPCMFGCPRMCSAIFNFCHFVGFFFFNFKYFIHFSKYSFVLDAPICVATILNFYHFGFFCTISNFGKLS